MAEFTYEVLDKTGKAKKGNLQAESIDKARAMLKADGSTILKLEAATLFNRELGGGKKKGKKVKSRDLGVFCKQFNSILHAGIGMTEALEMLSQQSNNKTLNEAIKNVRDNVQKGDTLAAAMKKEGDRVFPGILINMIEAGEASGSLEVALERMSTHFDKDAKTKGMIKKAMMYPMVLIIVTIIIMIVMLVGVFPSFAGTFREMGEELPAYTQAVMRISDSLIENWYIWVIAIVVLVFAYRTYSKSESGSRRIARIIRKIPVFGDLVTKSECARFSRNLSTLLAAGMPLIEAIEITAKTLSNVLYKDALKEAVSQVQKGVPLSAPLRASGLFPPLVLQMLAIGEESGDMEGMLDNVAEYFDEEVQLTTETATSLMEPLIIVVMAVVVIAIIAAIYAPILGMYGAAEGN